MTVLDRVIGALSPRLALDRARARQALEVMANYRGARVPWTSPGIRPTGADADAAAQARSRLSAVARDFTRNNGLAERALQVITNNVVGSGIHSKLVTGDKALADEYLARVRATLDTVAVDADGTGTLAGIQRMMVRAMVQDGECLLVWPETQDRSFRVRVLEADFLDDRLTGHAAQPGNVLHDGIEYGPDGRVVAYHLYEQHPGTDVLDWHRGAVKSQRVPASRVIHLYRADRPGQRRGVTWFAPVMEDMAAIADNDEAQMMRQKIAACFAAFWRTDKQDAAAANIPLQLAPGVIQQIGADDDVLFTNPPDVTGYDDFARVHLRRIAAGLGLTYEDLTGDLTGVNFSSARVGRMTFSQNVDAWQWTIAIPRLCQPFGRWFLQSWGLEEPRIAARLAGLRIDWTPPPPVVADPKNETQVTERRLALGLTSRRREIRALGYDPEDIDADIRSDPLADQFRQGSAPAPNAGEEDLEQKERELSL